jgi:hypothetical protein
MDEKQMQGDINSIIKMLGAKQELLSLKGQVNYFRQRLMDLCDTVEQDAKIEYTGWYVLIKKTKEGWKCLGTFSPDTCSEEQAEDLEKPEMEWDICLPIPTLETIKEFQGW